MMCVICKQGRTQPGTVTVPLQRGTATVIIKDVPAEVCENCGEYYLSEQVSNEILRRADAAVANGAEIEIIRYAA